MACCCPLIGAMRSTALTLLLVAVSLAVGCASARSPRPASVLQFEQRGTPRDGFGESGPDIPFIVKGEREDVLAAADVIVFWGGHSKFGGMLFKRNGLWYATGGFMGGMPAFLKEEAKMTSGLVVYVSPSDHPFNDTKYGVMIARQVAETGHGPWRFGYIEESRFGKMPSYRDYYNEQNEKITYPDY